MTRFALRKLEIAEQARIAAFKRSLAHERKIENVACLECVSIKNVCKSVNGDAAPLRACVTCYKQYKAMFAD